MNSKNLGKVVLVAGALVLALILLYVWYEEAPGTIHAVPAIGTYEQFWSFKKSVREEVPVQQHKEGVGVSEKVPAQQYKEGVSQEVPVQQYKEGVSEEVQVQQQKNGLEDSTVKLLVRVHDRIHKCLDTTEMRDYLQQKGLLNTSLTTATRFVRRIRELIPESFLTQSPNHCWSKNVSLHVKRYARHEIEAWGRYGDIEVRYKGKDVFQSYITRTSIREDFLKESMVCLPQVFLAGFAKCGSSYLFSLLKRHPMIVRPRAKEPHWWLFTQYHTQDITQNGLFFTNYLLMYKPLVTQMLKTQNFNLLSVDGTPSKMYRWPPFGGEPSEENYCLLPAVLPEILPRAKYLAVMRNPIDMLYSAFWYSCTHRGGDVPKDVQPKGPDIFHERVLSKIISFKSCIKHFPLVKCVIDASPNIFSSELHCGRSRIEMALYYVHVHKWLSVVPRSKFLFLTLEEISTDTNGSMARVWQFLGLPHMNLGSVKTVNQQKTVDYHHDPRLAMREDTRELLEDFFAPYNQMLADLLGDDKFLWTT